MSRLLSNRAAVSPESTALLAPEHLNDSLSYSELLDRVRTVEKHLSETDLCMGERVGLIMENRPELVSLFFAALEGGYSPVFLHERATSEELSDRCDEIDASLLVCSSKTESRVREAVDNAPVLSVDDPGEDQVVPLQDAERTTAHTASERETEQHVILFTSGSTGDPKPVCLSMGNLKASAHASACRLGHLPSDVWYDPLPMHHMGGLAPIVRSTLYGSTVLLKSFSADMVPDAVRTHNVSGASMVPTMLSRILNKGHWSSPPDSLRFLLLGGASVPENLIEQARERNLPIHPTYGMTETASQVATATPQECFDDPSTVGYPLLETTIRICDEDGRSKEPGEEGIIYVEGPTVMEGYLHRPLLNDRVLTDIGFRTGDRGYLDEEGRLHVLDDRLDQIVTGGEKVNPDEVENVLTSDELVQDAAVFGVEDDEWGERVVALVKMKDGAASETELRSQLDELLEQRLASYKHPKQIAVVSEIPRSSDGTVRKEEAREHLPERS